MLEDSAHTVLSTTALSKFFGRKAALRNLHLNVPRGGVHAVVGSNGAGKTTLFRVLLGLLEPSCGTSRVLGTDSQGLTPEVRERIGLVHEEHILPGWMKVRELERLQRSLYGRWHEGTYREVLGHFHVLPDQRVRQLSRGERAGLNLALALAQRPELLILDEPTLGLDVVAKQAFLESLLFTGQRDDCTIVYCSHQMDEIERVADNLIILERGELASMSAPEELCARIGGWVASFERPPRPENVPGLLQLRPLDDLHQLVVLDPQEGFEAQLERLGATGIQRFPVGLDRAVNAYLTRHHLTPAS